MSRRHRCAFCLEACSSDDDHAILAELEDGTAVLFCSDACMDRFEHAGDDDDDDGPEDFDPIAEDRED